MATIYPDQTDESGKGFNLFSWAWGGGRKKPSVGVEKPATGWQRFVNLLSPDRSARAATPAPAERASAPAVDDGGGDDVAAKTSDAPSALPASAPDGGGDAPVIDGGGAPRVSPSHSLAAGGGAASYAAGRPRAPRLADLRAMQDAPEKKSFFRKDFIKSAALSAGVTFGLKTMFNMTGGGLVVTTVGVAAGKTLILDVGKDVLKLRKEKNLTTAQALKSIFVTDVYNAYTKQGRADKYAATLARLEEKALAKQRTILGEKWGGRYRRARASLSTVFNDQVAPYKYTKKFAVNLAGATAGVFGADLLGHLIPAETWTNIRHFMSPAARFLSNSWPGQWLGSLSQMAQPLASRTAAFFAGVGSSLAALKDHIKLPSLSGHAPAPDGHALDAPANVDANAGSHVAPPPAADASAPADVPAAPAPVEYTPHKGEGLYRIAKRFDTTVEKLAAYNGIKDINVIRGDVPLKIPPADYQLPGSHAVATAANSSASSVADVRPTVSGQPILRPNARELLSADTSIAQPAPVGPVDSCRVAFGNGADIQCSNSSLAFVKPGDVINVTVSGPNGERMMPIFVGEGGDKMEIVSGGVPRIINTLSLEGFFTPKVDYASLDAPAPGMGGGGL